MVFQIVHHLFCSFLPLPINHTSSFSRLPLHHQPPFHLHPFSKINLVNGLSPCAAEQNEAFLMCPNVHQQEHTRAITVDSRAHSNVTHAHNKAQLSIPKKITHSQAAIQTSESISPYSLLSWFRC